MQGLVSGAIMLIIHPGPKFAGAGRKALTILVILVILSCLYQS